MSPEVLQSSVDIDDQPKVVSSEGGFFIIGYGSKTLELMIDLRGEHGGRGKARTKIDAVDGKSRRLGETTALYQFALSVMREIGSDHRMPIRYVFSTSNPTMKAWALHPEKGMGVFDWDWVKNGRKKFEAHKVILPESLG